MGDVGQLGNKLFKYCGSPKSIPFFNRTKVIKNIPFTDLKLLNEMDTKDKEK
jgi:hypothetical protein